jgi:hypothetical protein
MMLLQRRGRKGSGDLPGLQSRRFGPSRVEWWIRLPHASAIFIQRDNFQAMLEEMGHTTVQAEALIENCRMV